MFLVKRSFLKIVRVGLNKLPSVTLASDLHQPNERLDRLALAKVVTEGDAEARDLVVLLEPVLEQSARNVRCSLVAAVPPSIHRLADLRY